MPRNVNLLVGCLLVVLLATACGGGTSVFSLEVGDCFDDSPSQATELSEVDEVPCSESHDNEVYAVGDHPANSDAPYPGGNALDDYSTGYCLSEFGNYVGIDYQDSRLDLAYLLPDTGRMGGRRRPRGRLLPLRPEPRQAHGVNEGQPRVARPALTRPPARL